MAKSDYSDKTKAELDEIARARNIEGRSSMSRDELEKAIDKSRKAGTTSTVVTPREGQGEAKGVAYLEDGEERELDGGEIPPAKGGTADQGSMGGTITGPDTGTPAATTINSPTRPTTNP